MPIDANLEIKKPSLLVVEGYDELFFFSALIRRLRLQNIQIMPPYEGKTNLRDYLEGLKTTTGYAANVISLGIERDANGDSSAAFQSAQSALRAAKFHVPSRPLVTEGRRPKVTVMIVSEMLDDLCLRTVGNDSAMVCVDRYFQCLRQNQIPPPRNMYKAKVQAFLASRRRAGLRLGEAAHAGYWPFGSSALDEAKDFLVKVNEAGMSQIP